MGDCGIPVDTVLRTGAPAELGFKCPNVEAVFLIKGGALITAQRLPVLGGLIPKLTLRRVAAARTVVEHLLSDIACRKKMMVV